MKEKIYNFMRNQRKKRFFKNIYERWQDIHTIVLFFLICFSILVWKMFSYTFLNYEFYTALADKQQIGTFSVPSNRGTIYSSIDKNGVIEKGSFFATSINLYDLAIDPSEVGDKEKLGEFLIDLVYDEICKNKSKSKCKNNLLKFLRVIDLEDFDYSKEYIKTAIGNRIIPRINQVKTTNRIIGTDFSDEKVFKISRLKIPGFYAKDGVVGLNPEEYIQTEESLEKISEILEISVDKLKPLTERRKVRYVKIFNKLSINSSDEIRKIIKDEKSAYGKGILKEENTIYKFFIMEKNPSRYYPENEIASQIIGYMDNSGVGRYGIEGYFNEILKGNNGKIVAKKDAHGRIINTISLDKNDLIGEGVKIYTTIDRNIQKKVEEILENGVKKYRANKGTIVITEPKTGKIISMANYPSYDSNNYSDVSALEKVTSANYPNPSVDLLGMPVFVQDSENGEKMFYDNKEIFLREAKIDELGNPALVKYKYKNGFGYGVYKNDAISGTYEPGSIMKSISVAIGLDTGEINGRSRYLDEGSVKIDDYTINNESTKCLGTHTFEHALDYSCNVGMVRIFQRVGKALVSEYFENFGFGEKTGVDLAGEEFVPMTPWEKWPVSKLLSQSYGLGISVTPLQMASAYNVLANGGIYVKPRIIEKIVYPNKTEIKFKTEEKRRVIKEETSRLITKMLKHGVDYGLAKNGAVEGYSLAGKTGTAQIFGRKVGGLKSEYQSGPGWTNASYAGYGPVEDPKFVIIVKLERPRTNVYGSATSGELFSEVASYLFDYYGIPKSRK